MTAALRTGGAGYADGFALLAEMTRDFAASLELEVTLGRALDSIARHVGAEAGSLWLLSADGSELACVASVGASPITGARLPAGEGIVGRCVRANAGERLLDARSHPDFSGRIDAQSGFVTRSLLCAPLAFSGRVFGAVELVNKRGADGRFAERDAQLLEVLTASAGLAVANAELSRARVEGERVRRELELAAEIQRGLLPPSRPAPFPLQAVNVPARTVSGDFYDYLELADGRLAFCLGDVSGKGMNAALLGARTASLYRCLARDADGPGAVLARLDAELHETATRGMFVTLAAGVYDPRSGRVRLANAGHEPPLLVRPDGGVESFPAQAPPLGVLGNAEFPERAFPLDGGCLYVFTDGLTEASGPGGAPLGADGVLRLLARHGASPLRERIDAAVAELGALGLRDDATLLGLCGAAARPAPDASGPLRLCFPARASELRGVRDAVRAHARAAGCGEACAHDVVCAVDEACQNVIRHAYAGRDDGEIVLELEARGGELAVTVRDFAPPVDPESVRPRALDELRPGGLGTHLIRTLMDEAAFAPAPPDGGNLFRMRKRIA